MSNRSSGESSPILHVDDGSLFFELLDGLESMPTTEFAAVISGLAKCPNPSDRAEYHEACRLVAESLESRLKRSFDDCESIVRGMIEDLPYNGLMGDTLYLVAMEALLKQCCDRGVGGGLAP